MVTRRTTLGQAQGKPQNLNARLGPNLIQDGANGESIVAFLCWIGQRLLLQEDVILHENVPQFLKIYIFLCTTMSRKYISPTEHLQVFEEDTYARRIVLCI